MRVGFETEPFYKVFSRIESRRTIFGVTISETACVGKMSSIPISKAMVSQMQMSMQQADQWYNKNQESPFSPPSDSQQYLRNAPKYNGKLMNSIWGMYNMYAPPSFQKNSESGSGPNAAGTKAAGIFGWRREHTN